MLTTRNLQEFRVLNMEANEQRVQQHHYAAAPKTNSARRTDSSKNNNILTDTFITKLINIRQKYLKEGGEIELMGVGPCSTCDGRGF